VDHDKLSKVKEERLNRELSKLISKFKTDMKIFEDKVKQSYDEMRFTRSKETEKTILKYKNKLKDLEKSRDLNILEITHPGKLYSRNASKISIMSKGTGPSSINKTL